MGVRQIPIILSLLILRVKTTMASMKMQQVLRADWSGLVSAVHVGPGHQIKDGDIIVELT